MARKVSHEKAIRNHARRMWESDGCPAGRLSEYIERARELQAIMDNPKAGLLPNPMTLHHGEIEPASPIEEAELQENLGEFPSPRGEDQGDRLQLPMARRRPRNF
jgi:Protein of unknown function (DUF2934)